MDNLNLVAVGDRFINLATIAHAKWSPEDLTVRFIDGSTVKLKNPSALLLGDELSDRSRDLQEVEKVKARGRAIEKARRAT